MYEEWRIEQARHLIKLPYGSLAETLDVSKITLSRWANAMWPVPNWQAWRIANAQQDLTYQQRQARRHNILVLPRPTPSATRSPLSLLAAFASLVNQAIEQIVSKLQRGEKLSREECEQAHKILDEAAATVEALRQLVQEQEGNP